MPLKTKISGSLRLESTACLMCNTCKIVLTSILSQRFDKTQWTSQKSFSMVRPMLCMSYGNPSRIPRYSREGCIVCFLFIQETSQLPQDWNAWLEVFGDESPDLVSNMYLVMSRYTFEQQSNIQDFDRSLYEVFRYSIFTTKPTNEDLAKYTNPTPRLQISLQDSIKSRLCNSICLDSNSKACFQLASEWLTTCRESHSLCNRKRGSGWLPTRLVDVGPLDGSLEPRLVLSGGMHGEYATLSHRWGEIAEQFSTTQENLESHKREIKLSSLPATFRDAIIVTRQLSLRYLWIDSICIVQDCQADWASESSRMSNIYEHAAVNISALKSNNSNDGLFHHSSAENPFVIMQLDADDELIGVKLTPADFGAALRKSSMSSRAWILQERIFSPAILHYGEEQVFWECSESRASENSASMTPNTFSVLKDYMEQTPGCILHPEGHYSAWYQVAVYYNKLDLTVESDRLFAIHGLSKSFSKAFGVKYLVGLWLEDLHRGLLWWCGNKSRQQLQIAPSWSWLGYGKDIEFGWPGQEFPRAE